MPTQLGEGMTGSRTNPALPQRICAITAWRRPTTTQSAAAPRHPPTACTGPAQRQDRSSSLRCGRSVLTPVLTRRCPHGGRKPTKPLVANVLTEPHPFRDDKMPLISGRDRSPRRWWRQRGRTGPPPMVRASSSGPQAQAATRRPGRRPATRKGHRSRLRRPHRQRVGERGVDIEPRFLPAGWSSRWSRGQHRIDLRGERLTR